MPLGTKVGLSPGNIVLDGDPAIPPLKGHSPPPPRKGHSSPPLFGPCLLWPRSPISATAELAYLEPAKHSYTEPDTDRAIPSVFLACAVLS